MLSNIELWQGDCLELMKTIPDGIVDCIYNDPPFATTQNSWDRLIPFDKMWAEYKRICKPNAAIVIHATDPFSSALLMSNPTAWKQTLVWKKNIASNFLNAKRQHLAIHENILVFSFGTPVYNPQMQPGKPYTNKRSGKDDSGDCYGQVAKRTDTVNNGERYPQTVLEFKREVGLHPTQKPRFLAEYLISTYSNGGDLVFDPTMGSGTSGLAAKNTGRDFLGFELDENYFNIAKERIYG